jgi:hypothetical protein
LPDRLGHRTLPTMRPHLRERQQRGCSDLLSAYVYDCGPAKFTVAEVTAQRDLLAHRNALFYTPTTNLPAEWIGIGDLDVRLFLPTPDYLATRENRAYMSPRLWVDLLQRATQRIRWTPRCHPGVVFTRYGQERLRNDHLAIGAKALLDALKVSTTGRADRRSLYYFGAIYDDGPDDVDVDIVQEVVRDPRDCGTRVQVLDRREWLIRRRNAVEAELASLSRS